MKKVGKKSRGAIRVLLVDHHQAALIGMRAELASAADIVVVGQSSSGKEGLDMLRACKPDVIVMDCHLQDGVSGKEMAGLAFRQLPKARLIGACEDALHARDIRRMLNAGAAGILEKSTLCEDLVRAIRMVHAGLPFFGASLGTVIRDAFLHTRTRLANIDISRLPPRQRQIYEMIRSGMRTKDIAAELHRSERTIEAHRSRMLRQPCAHPFLPGYGRARA